MGSVRIKTPVDVVITNRVIFSFGIFQCDAVFIRKIHPCIIGHVKSERYSTGAFEKEFYSKRLIPLKFSIF